MFSLIVFLHEALSKVEQTKTEVAILKKTNESLHQELKKLNEKNSQYEKGIQHYNDELETALQNSKSLEEKAVSLSAEAEKSAEYQLALEQELRALSTTFEKLEKDKASSEMVRPNE